MQQYLQLLHAVHEHTPNIWATGADTKIRILVAMRTPTKQKYI